MSNNLFESAVNILNSSVKSAPSMPPQKLNGEVQDIGGPTTTNNKPDDESNKLDSTKGTKQATAPKTKPSDANGKVVSSLSREDVQLDINNIFSEDVGLSAEFKEKVATIYEARVQDQINQIKSQLEEQYSSLFESKIEEINESLVQHLDSYLDYIVQEWVEQNEIAIQSALRSEITEDFIYAMKSVFKEHYIDVPDDKVDVVEELALRVEELETNLNEQINNNVKLNKALNESKKLEIVASVCEELTVTQKEKIKSLVENVEFTNEEEFKERVSTIRENYFPSTYKKISSNQLNEHVESQHNTSPDIYIDAVVQAINKTRF